MAIPAWQSRWNTLIFKITRLHSAEELEAQIETFGNVDKPHVLAFANAHAMNCAAESEPFFTALKAADTIFRDGSGMAALFKMLSAEPGLNLNGTDLIPKLIAHFNGRPIALYGTQEPYLSQAKKTIATALAPNSQIHLANGFLPPQDYVPVALQDHPSMIILGMGMPKQEQVAALLRDAIPNGCVIVCGGAIIDFLGHKVTRAPQWLRKWGLEWVYRLVIEPNRLFKRYVLGNPKFLARTLALKRQIKCI